MNPRNEFLRFRVRLITSFWWRPLNGNHLWIFRHFPLSCQVPCDRDWCISSLMCLFWTTKKVIFWIALRTLNSSLYRVFRLRPNLIDLLVSHGINQVRIVGMVSQASIALYSLPPRKIQPRTVISSCVSQHYAVKFVYPLFCFLFCPFS